MIFFIGGRGKEASLVGSDIEAKFGRANLRGRRDNIVASDSVDAAQRPGTRRYSAPTTIHVGLIDRHLIIYLFAVATDRADKRFAEVAGARRKRRQLGEEKRRGRTSYRAQKRG